MGFLDRPVTRRRVLRGSFGAIAAASVPGAAEARPRRAPDTKRERAPHESPVDDWHELVSEADRELKLGFISIGKTPELIEDYEQTIRQMHPKAKALAIVHRESRAFAEELKRRVRPRTLVIETINETAGQQDDYWGRDFGVTILKGPEKKPVLITSSRRSWDGDLMEYADERAKQIAAARTKLFAHAGIDVVEAPFPFEGGNISFDDQGRVFIGYDVLFTRTSDDAESELTDAQRASRSETQKRQMEERVARVKEYFKATDVVVLGSERQSDLYHTDLSVLILPGKQALITWFPDDYVESAPSADRKKLRAGVRDQQVVIEQQLKDAGLAVHRVMHSAKELDSSNVSINAIPFTRDGKRHVLIPVYRDQRVDQSKLLSPDHTYQEDDVRHDSSAIAAAKACRALGYQVVFVGASGIGFSGIHCILNQLARAEGMKTDAPRTMRADSLWRKRERGRNGPLRKLLKELLKGK